MKPNTPSSCSERIRGGSGPLPPRSPRRRSVPLGEEPLVPRAEFTVEGTEFRGMSRWSSPRRPPPPWSRSRSPPIRCGPAVDVHACASSGRRVRRARADDSAQQPGCAVRWPRSSRPDADLARRKVSPKNFPARTRSKGPLGRDIARARRRRLRAEAEDAAGPCSRCDEASHALGIVHLDTGRACAACRRADRSGHHVLAGDRSGDDGRALGTISTSRSRRSRRRRGPRLREAAPISRPPRAAAVRSAMLVGMGAGRVGVHGGETAPCSCRPAEVAPQTATTAIVPPGRSAGTPSGVLPAATARRAALP